MAITGASGLVGGAVAEAFRRRGWEVSPVVRRAARSGEVFWDPDGGRIDAARLEGFDGVVHTAAEPIAGMWTAGKKRRIRDSRVKGTVLLAGTLAGLQAKPRWFVSVSAVGYYGDRPSSQPMTEEEPAGASFLSRLCQEWEDATREARDAGIRVLIPRLANVLSREGGMLGALKPVFRMGLGAVFGGGKQMWPWVTIEDVVAAMLHAVDEGLEGPVNVASPGAVTQAEFMKSLAAALNRPLFVRVPAFAVKLAPGDMGQELLLSGAWVVPARLESSGFTFRGRELKAEMKRLVGSGHE